MRGGLILLSLFMSLPLSAAELIVKAPLRVLAVSPQQSISGSNLTLSPGEHQLLVRYEGVLPARSNSESDIEVTSDPQVLHVLVKGDETLTLSAPSVGPSRLISLSRADATANANLAARLPDRKSVV